VLNKIRACVSLCPRGAVLPQGLKLLLTQAEPVDILDLLQGGKDIEVRSEEESLHADSPYMFYQDRNSLGRFVRSRHVGQIRQHPPRDRVVSDNRPAIFRLHRSLSCSCFCGRGMMGINPASILALTVDSADHLCTEPVPAGTGKQRVSLASFGLLAASALLLIAVLVANFESQRVVLALRICLTVATLVFALLLANFIRERRRTERQAQTVFEDNVRDFQHMAENIQEIFWMMDPKTKKATFVNPAYETITGRSCQSLMDEPSSYEKLIHPEDRAHVLIKLVQAAQSGHFDERFRILRTDGEIRWVWVRGIPQRDSHGTVFRLGGTALDITALKRAEEQVAANLAKANSAWTEAEALRKATLALTEDLHMDRVLETLLRSLAELVPYSCARVLVPEGGAHWLALGEKSCPEAPKKSPRAPLTFVADQCPCFERICSERKRILIPDTAEADGWESFPGHTHFRSWLCVPLLAAEEFLGFLSVGHIEPNYLTEDHLRRAELLAIPAAVAIQNARLYSTAEIYGSELEKRLADLESARHALDESEESRRLSEERFEKIFDSSPIAFSITTLEEGRILEVNQAFELRYGYSRQEVVGHTVHDLRIWQDPAERRLLVAQVKRGAPIRNVVTRLRTKCGEIKLTAFSADRIQFGGQSCLLVVSGDVSSHLPKTIH
jgi:PAS domain S-box-containing protein